MLSSAGGTFLSFLLVGFLWGSTTPFLKESSSDSLTASELRLPKWQQIVLSLWRLLGRWRFLLAYAVNQSGSIGYYYLLGELGKVWYCMLFQWLILGSHDLSIAVPAANSLSFGFTALTEALCLNKTLPDRLVFITMRSIDMVFLCRYTMAGSVLILLGVFLCLYGKV